MGRPVRLIQVLLVRELSNCSYILGAFGAFIHSEVGAPDSQAPRPKSSWVETADYVLAWQRLVRRARGSERGKSQTAVDAADRFY